LQSAGALIQHKAYNPATVLYAMEVTKLRGQRHLWIDRLCIVQDDPITKHGQIRNMTMVDGTGLSSSVSAWAGPTSL